jgi:hypothetical protein
MRLLSTPAVKFRGGTAHTNFSMTNYTNELAFQNMVSACVTVP